MYAEVLYFGVGIFFGITIAYNRKDYRQEKTFEQVDEQVRNDLVRYKNLSESLKQDVRFLKNRISSVRSANTATKQILDDDTNHVPAHQI